MNNVYYVGILKEGKTAYVTGGSGRHSVWDSGQFALPMSRTAACDTVQVLTDIGKDAFLIRSGKYLNLHNPKEKIRIATDPEQKLFRAGQFYLEIHRTEGGFDYTIYAPDTGETVDGGFLENENLLIDEAAQEAAEILSIWCSDMSEIKTDDPEAYIRENSLSGKTN